MIPMELKFSVSYKLLVVCVSTVKRETDQLTQVSKHELVLHETLMGEVGHLAVFSKPARQKYAEIATSLLFLCPC